MPSERLVTLADVGATHRLAARITAPRRAGEVIALCGELGAGKTELARGIARALGVPPDVAVVSPSYLVMQLYSGGRLPLAHVDAYFLGDIDDLLRAGYDDLRAEGRLIVVEWADRLAETLPGEVLRVTLEQGESGPGSRRALLAEPRTAEHRA